MNSDIKKKISDIKRDIEKDLAANSRVSELAEKYNVEMGYLCDCFVQTFGCTPKEYMNQQRIQRLPELIKKFYNNVQNPALHIALELGYSRRSCIYNFVERKTGMIWSEYCQSILENI